MSSILSKIGIKTAVDTRSNANLSCYHATTARQYEPRVTYFHEFVPSEHWHMDARCSVRTMPLIRPAIADIKVHNRFFFVPYFTIMDKWNAFLADTPIARYQGNQEIPQVPMFTERGLMYALTSTSAGFTSAGDASHYDFAYINSSGTTIYRLFTPQGRVAYSILLGLGYNVNLAMDFSSSTDVGLKYSALPLLAYLKVWLDWYNNTAFDVTTSLHGYFDLQNDQRTLGSTNLIEILQTVISTYLEKDYFVSATLNPMSPNSNTMQSNFTVPDITIPANPGNGNTQVTNQNGTGFVSITTQQTNDNRVKISKYAIEAVQSLTDYVKRHQIAGIQPFNRILSEYGVTLKDEELRRSTFIGDVIEDLDISTVVSNGYNLDENNPQILGERAGMANGGNSKKLDFKNDNYGCIICVTTVVPRTSYVDGVKKSCLRLDRFDFFTPEVEHLGVEPITVAEIKHNFTNPADISVDYTRIFGYMPRYASLKTALDTLSGDFCRRSVKTLYDPWVQRRVLDDPNVYQTVSLDFSAAKFDTNNSIFVEPDADNYIIFNMYHVNSNLPMHRLWDDYQWSNENENPRTVTLPNQGVQFT